MCILIDKILCPDEQYHFRMYINDKSCNDAQVSPMYQIDPVTGNTMPGMIGKLIFKNKDCIRTGVIAHEAFHMATTYIRVVTHENIVLNDEIDDIEENVAFYVGWFAARIGEVYWNYFAGKVI